ncbi:MAG TPA: FtsX-like permease family protein [Chitinophagales bacterium]|nr:FtsX-like permease family protein [Chitinophagales bacterium]
MLAFRIALRYIFSKKSTNAINVISRVSMLGMGVGAFALIVVLSVFNGFEGLVLSLYNSFYPDIEIRAVQGKTFEDNAVLSGKILKLDGVLTLSRTLEENAYLEYGDEAQLATIKGVDEKYNEVTTVQQYVRDGRFMLRDTNRNYTVVGANIGYSMNMDVTSGIEPLRITVPRKGVKTAFAPEDAFNTMSAYPVGVFSIQQEFDSKYVFVNLDFARELLGEENRVSAYEVKLSDGTDIDAAKERIAAAIGKDYEVKTRYEQRADTYRVMMIERWVTTAILGFIILIISFNIIGSLSMLVIEKTRDISILKAMGADAKMIKQIYLLNGMLSSMIGAFTGLALGYLIVILQLKFHFLKLSSGGDSSFVINYYPVKLKLIDPIVTLAIIVSISLLASYFPAKRAGQSAMSFK